MGGRERVSGSGAKFGQNGRKPAKTIDYCGFCGDLATMLRYQKPAGKDSTMVRFPSLFAALLTVSTALLFAAGAARADELQDIGKLLKQGQQAQALERVNQFLAQKPKDAQGRFLKGLILTEQNKTAEAIDVFTKLTQDYPELPEPYNNLAVLYAAQGQYEKARQSLEMSIRTHPAYATAYENLGDVYTKLASQAYDKALQLDSGNAGAQSKLALIRDLIGGRGQQRPSAGAAPRPAPTVVAAAPKAGAPAPAATPAAPATSATAPAIEAKTSKAADKAAEPKKNGNDEVLKSVRAWAAAWAAKDVNGYLAHYAKDFKAPKGESRADWEKGRRQRINAPKKIEVGVESPKVTMVDDNRASVTFRQNYRSDSLSVSSTKTLSLVRVNDRWLIREERVGS